LPITPACAVKQGHAGTGILPATSMEKTTMYLWVKTFHVVFVIAWMASVFYLPRILVNLAESSGQQDVQTRLKLMGRRLYRFGHIMFGLALIPGLVLWLGYRILPDFPTMVAPGSGWVHAKLTLVALILIHYIIGGRWLKGMDKGRALPSSKALRWFNELPVLLLVGVVYLVLMKPF
jgi:putative membrane protein